MSRPDWRRILRAYDIRKDLEHEDDEYEAGVEDCVYIFKTCVEVVLARDPVHLIKLTDIKEIIEKSDPAALNEGVLEDFQHAPETRQGEIYKFLLSSSLNEDLPDVVRQNCYAAFHALRPLTQNAVLLATATQFTDRIGKRGPTLLEARVAHASGVLPYLKRAQLRDFYGKFFIKMEKVGYAWGAFNQHGELLRNLREIGGLDYCPDEYIDQYIEWLVLCYIGSPGGRTQYGNVRHVFYSNIGAPIAFSILADTSRSISEMVELLERDSKNVSALLKDEHVARRFHAILDVVEK